MYTFTWDGEPPTVADVCERYGLSPDEIDAEFGVIAIDPQDNLYTILVNRDAVQRLIRHGKQQRTMTSPARFPIPHQSIWSA